jgi:hypothetical protein
LRLERTLSLPNGAAMCVIIERPENPVRVLVVDGVSDPFILRTPLLNSVAAYCRESPASGMNIDVIAGDFNALGRSVGFDSVRAAGYALASDRCGGWRGTYPTLLPLYDIDHVWAGSAVRVADCRFFTAAGSNHRGQLVTLSPAK